MFAKRWTTRSTDSELPVWVLHMTIYYSHLLTCGGIMVAHMLMVGPLWKFWTRTHFGVGTEGHMKTIFLKYLAWLSYLTRWVPNHMSAIDWPPFDASTAPPFSWLGHLFIRLASDTVNSKTMDWFLGMCVILRCKHKCVSNYKSVGCRELFPSLLTI